MRLVMWSLLAIIFFGACAQSKTSVKSDVLSKVGQQSNEAIDLKTYQASHDSSKNDTSMAKSLIMKPLEEVMGKFDPKNHEDFVVIERRYADQSGRLMHREAYSSFISMWEHAQKDGVSLTIRSATRNFDYQKGIWERKWTGATQVGGKKLSETMPNHEHRALKILEYSSMPGTSRHHWGTDIDINSFENSYFEKGQGLVEYNWLQEYAAIYGFCQPYTPKGVERPDGYNEEKWHWSYLPVANQYLLQAKTNMKDKMISGFRGSETAVEIGVVEKYILGINKTCK